MKVWAVCKIPKLANPNIFMYDSAIEGLTVSYKRLFKILSMSPKDLVKEKVHAMKVTIESVIRFHLMHISDGRKVSLFLKRTEIPNTIKIMVAKKVVIG